MYAPMYAYGECSVCKYICCVFLYVAYLLFRSTQNKKYTQYFTLKYT